MDVRPLTFMSKPDPIAIAYDNYHAKNIGRLPEGGQFFLTTPFIQAIGRSAGREFIALFLFDKRGRFLEARIDDLGTRGELDTSSGCNTHES